MSKEPNQRFLNVVKDNEIIGDPNFGSHFLDANQLGWPNKGLYEQNLAAFLAHPDNYDYTFSTRAVYKASDIEFGELTKKIIEKATWSFGDYGDAYIGIKNYLINFDVISQSDLMFSTEEFSAQSAAIVGAGPSLSDTIGELKKYKGLIICADAAMEYLEEEGITPHYVVSTERQPKTAQIFAEYQPKADTKMICPTVIHPEILENYPNEKLFYGPAAITWSPKIFPTRSCYVASPVCGNSAVSQALRAGVKNIGLFGIDYTYSDSGESHSKVRPVVTGFRRTKELEVIDNSNNKRQTNFVWNAAAQTLNMHIAFYNYPKKVYSTSKIGIKLPQIKYQDAKRWVTQAKIGYKIKRNGHDTTKVQKAHDSLTKELKFFDLKELEDPIKVTKVTSFKDVSITYSLILMLVYRIAVISRSKIFAFPHKKDEILREYKEHLERAKKDLEKLVY